MRLDRWGLLLLPVLAVALGLRVYGINFGLPALNDPDELMFVLGSIRMLKGLSFNPGWFGHPATTTMYGLALLDIASFAGGYAMGLFHSVRGFAEVVYANPTWAILPGRLMMAVFGTAVVRLTARLGRQLFDRPTGLAAAALLAVNPMEVYWSQVIRTDIMATFFMLLCMLAALRVAREGRWRDHVLASLWLGLAIATKWPFATSGLAIAGALALRLLHAPEGIRAGWPRAAIRLALCAMMGIGFLLLTSPYLVIEHETVLRNLHGEAQLHHLGATGGTPWQNVWWYLRGPIWAGMGTVGLVLVALGLPRFIRQREAMAILVPAALALFVINCLQHLVWERWALPLFPLLAIVAGVGLVALCRRVAVLLGRGNGTSGPALAAQGLLVALALVPLAITAHANDRARLDDTRQQASRWAIAHIPPGSTVMIEHFAFDLYPQQWTFLFPLGEVGCVDAKAMLRGKVGYSAIDSGRNGRSNVDYGTLSPATRPSCRSDYAIISQYDRYRQEQANFPKEYAAYRQLLAQGTIVASFAADPGRSVGPTIRIVHFADGPGNSH